MRIRTAKLTILFVFFLLTIFACEKEKGDIEDKRLQKEWILVSFYDKEAEEFIEYPEDMDKIWIRFTKDSVFLHSFCPTVDSEYQIHEDSMLSVRGFIMQDEFCQLYENPPYWDHDLASGLRRATQYQVTDNELAIFSDGRYDMYFTEKED